MYSKCFPQLNRLSAHFFRYYSFVVFFHAGRPVTRLLPPRLPQSETRRIWTLRQFIYYLSSFLLMQVDPVTRVLSIALVTIKGAKDMDIEPISQTISFVLVGLSFLSLSLSLSLFLSLFLSFSLSLSISLSLSLFPSLSGVCSRSRSHTCSGVCSCSHSRSHSLALWLSCTLTLSRSLSFAPSSLALSLSLSRVFPLDLLFDVARQ